MRVQPKDYPGTAIVDAVDTDDGIIDIFHVRDGQIRGFMASVQRGENRINGTFFRGVTAVEYDLAKNEGKLIAGIS